MYRVFENDYPDDTMAMSQKLVLGMQHTFTMFGATVLVPVLTGMNISVALFMAGMGTLIFHVITKGRVPAFMGSSFAFITPTQSVAAMAGFGLAYAQGGLFVAGIIYILFGILIYFIGYEKIMNFFPPIVTGPIIMVIGLTLAPVAIENASKNWGVAIVSFGIVAGVSIFAKGFLQVLPVLIGLVGGYLFAMMFGLVDLSPVAEAKYLGIPDFTIAKFNITTIMMVAPIAIVTMVEHIGDVMAIGATCNNKDFVKSPGLHRTVIGDGVAICFSTFFGGPACTTYSENTGVLAITKVYNPQIVRIAACFAIILGIVPKLGALISTIPAAVIGGISIILFGMIASIGARTLIEHQVDLSKSRNLIISAVILVLGLGGASIPVTIFGVSFVIEGIALAAFAGIVLNKIFPKDKAVKN